MVLIQLKNVSLPLATLGWSPKIADYTEQGKCENIPESCDNPGTLPPFVEGICCFEINLHESDCRYVTKCSYII